MNDKMLAWWAKQNTVIIFLLMASTVFGMLWPTPTLAQTEPEVDELVYDISHSYTFGSEMVFELDLINDPPVAEAILIANVSSYQTPIIHKFPLSQAEPFAEVNFRHKLQLQEVRIPPFAQITYAWDIVLVSDLEESKAPTTTPSETFFYEDNRIDWIENRAVDGGIRIFTTDESGELGQIGLNVANQAISNIQQLVPVEITVPISIYLYPSTAVYQDALDLTGAAWSGGYSAPQFGVVMLPVDNINTAQIDLNRRLPHELSHLLLFRATGTQYEQVPRWFDEGLATQFEDPANEDYDKVVEEALRENRLIPLETLCTRFPGQPADTVLQAYSQSHSFVKYLRAEFGDEVIRNMILEMRDGADCDSVMTRIFNVPLEEMEDAWQATTNPVQYILNFDTIWVTGGFILTTLIIIGVLWVRSESTHEK